MVVILVIGLISAIAMPRLIPLIAFSQLEGNARRLANYGRAAQAEATFRRQRHVVRFDLDADPQQYYLVKWVVPEEEGTAEKQAPPSGEIFGEGEENPMASAMDALPGLSKSISAIEDEDIEFRMQMRGRDPGILTQEEFDAERMKMAVDDQFDGFHRRMLELRAENVKLPEEFMDEVDLFENRFSLEEDPAEPVELEVTNSILKRVYLPKGLYIDRITVDGEGRSRGLIEVELTALGLAQYVGMHLVNEDNEYYTVIWDPIAGQTKWMPGREDI